MAARHPPPVICPCARKPAPAPANLPIEHASTAHAHAHEDALSHASVCLRPSLPRSPLVSPSSVDCQDVSQRSAPQSVAYLASPPTAPFRLQPSSRSHSSEANPRMPPVSTPTPVPQHHWPYRARGCLPFPSSALSQPAAACPMTVADPPPPESVPAWLVLTIAIA